MNTIYYNGKIITMADHDEKSISYPEAVLVSDGIINKVGSMKKIRAYSDGNTEWIDLKGKCLMPAFIDAHSHVVMNAQMSLFADLTECNSFDDIVDTLGTYVKVHNINSDRAIVGFGYDHNFLKENRQPNKFVLDKVSKTIPVMILHVSGHLACVNSVALKLSGINGRINNPDGGIVGRIEGTNEPDGYLEETAMALAQNTIFSRISMDISNVMENMQKVYIENGITTVQEGAASWESMKLLRTMSDNEMLKVDVVAYPLIAQDGKKVIDEYKDIDVKYKNHLKIGGYKIILDGSPQGRSAWMSAPYEGDDKKYCGYPYYENGQVENYINQALKEKKQILAHCNGDAASEQFISAYEKCLKKEKLNDDLRPVMVHCQTVRNDQLDRMAKMNMMASIFVGHVWYWGDVHLKNFGEIRGNHISPVKDAIDRNIKVTFHQDTPVTKPNMLHSVWCAVNRVSRNGIVIGREQVIDVYDALKAVTINAAYGYFEENIKGSIEEGKKADLVVLSNSPLEIEKDKIKDIRVVETIKDGESIYK